MTLDEALTLQGKGKTWGTAELHEKFTAASEVVARREAERTGFDMEKEPSALFRMLATVLASNELRKEALDLVKARDAEDSE